MNLFVKRIHAFVLQFRVNSLDIFVTVFYIKLSIIFLYIFALNTLLLWIIELFPIMPLIALDYLILPPVIQGRHLSCYRFVTLVESNAAE